MKYLWGNWKILLIGMTLIGLSIVIFPQALKEESSLAQEKDVKGISSQNKSYTPTTKDILNAVSTKVDDQETLSPSTNDTLIECIGPDGKIAKASEEDCGTVNNFWNKIKSENQAKQTTTSNSSDTDSSNNSSTPTATPTPTPTPITPAITSTIVTDKDHIRGNKNAAVTLIEYSDLECPFCQRFHPTMKEIMTTYGDNVRWIYRHYPLNFHANAQKEAESSECVAELGGNDAFWNYVDKIFERTTSNGTGFALDKLGPLAAEIGVNQIQFQSCLDSARYEKLVKDQMAVGTASGVNGTPSTFIVNSKGGNQIIVGAQPIESLKTVIDQQLAASK